MELLLHLPDEIPASHSRSSQDLVQLIRSNNWSELNQVPVCIDQHKITRANFGQNRWDCSPFASDKGSDKNQREFDFSYLCDSPTLLIEAKLVVYGWLYEQGHCFGQKCKLSTLTSRFNIGLKKALVSLKNNGASSLSELNSPDMWKRFEDDLQGESLSKRTIELAFTAIQSVERLNSWLPFEMLLPRINCTQLAIKLANQEKLEHKQSLAIPQALVNLLYGQAVNDVEKAWPHKEKLAQLERDLQSNYDIGRAAVDYKLTTGRWKWLYDAGGNLDSKRYTEEINKATPRNQSEIIAQHLTGTGLLPKNDADGNWLVSWRAKIQVACFICCGAFSGMRVSELFELHEDSFHTYTINGQTFHSISAATHKLAAGRKKDEWLTSPIVEKAISLAITLSSCAREQLVKLAAHSSDQGQVDTLLKISSNLWLSQYKRKNLPTLISRTKWNDRLKNYAKSVGAIVDEHTLSECRQLNPRNGGAIDEKVKLGQPWPFLTHQFRRTFACFAVRNGLGHPISIKQQFKHIHVRMSEWYGNGAIESRLQDIKVDSKLINLLNETRIEQTTAHFDSWFNGDEKLSGSFGKAIVAMRNDKPVIYSSWDNLYRLVKEKRLTLHGTLHSYCKNGYECDMDGVINAAFCIDCRGGGSIVDNKKVLWWQKKHHALSAYLKQQYNISHSEYAHCITQVRAAEKAMRDFGLQFEKYEHPVKVIDL
ncbi:hypothetical protein ACLH0G_15275 [Aeromonas rivipollensis]|uniref:hypothetical protein n=1 Tax=Aeromonas rivipollensis TaxID=948519 RepID=UPI001F20F374|nr:hypothetical protein [Aeromonas salmonicida]